MSSSLEDGNYVSADVSPSPAHDYSHPNHNTQQLTWRVRKQLLVSGTVLCLEARLQQAVGGHDSVVSVGIKNIGAKSPVLGQKRLLFVVSEDWYFESHRLDLALAAARAGWEVTVACRSTNVSRRIQLSGVAVINWEMPRKTAQPSSLLRSVLDLRAVIKSVSPTQIHAISLLTVLLTRAALIGKTGLPLVSTIAGLGRLRKGRLPLNPLLRATLLLAAHWLSRPPNRIVITQNKSDFESFGGRKNSNVRLIAGSGVNPSSFPLSPPKGTGPLTVALISRMIREKGVEEFIMAIRDLSSKGLNVRGILVGRPDPGNKGSLTESEINELTKNSSVDYLGHQDRILDTIVASDIVCLPSRYGEGIPKVLLEVACVGRPIVSSRVPGPTDLIREGRDGLLVDPGDHSALSEAIGFLAENPEKRLEFATSLRCRVLESFSDSRVVPKYLSIYDEAR